MPSALGADAAARPKSGDLSMCWYCGTIAFYDDELRLREPTVAEVDEAIIHPDVQRALSALWNHHVAIVGPLPAGAEFACGCRASASSEVDRIFVIEACSANCGTARSIGKMAEQTGKPFLVDPEWDGPR